MNERFQDCELLRQFVRQRDQAAFAAVVRRHLDLVYATALRKLEDPGAAEEVAQNVFAALARKAWQFAPDDSLPAWLHRTTLLEAKAWLRCELRRRRREHAAAELGTTMKTPDEQPALRELVPLLDEALLSLREKERTALLLRYYESQSLRDVGVSLGVSEDAARKRVGAALDSLAGFFQRRGFKTATAAATAAALQHTAAAAPATVAAAIAQTALQAVPPGIAGLVALLSRLASLTKVQAAALLLVLAAGLVSWQWHQTQAVRKDAATAQLAVEAVPAQQEDPASKAAGLRSESMRPDGALSHATAARARPQETARMADTLEARLFGLLTAAAYHWPEDVDFVRIPKSALKEFNLRRSVDTSGEIRDWGAELLGLTPEEKQQAEAVLGAHLQALGELAASRACETNYLVDALADWAGPPHKSVWVPPLGEDLQTLMAKLRAGLRQVLGAERTRLVLGDDAEGLSHFGRWLGALSDLSKGALVTITVDPDHPQGLEYGEFVNGAGGGFFYRSPNEVHVSLPEAIISRFFEPWLAQFGIINAASRARPTPKVASAADALTLSANLVARAPPPSIQSFSASGATLTVRGTNGASDWRYVVLASTNLMLPFAQWAPVLTNAVGVNGDFNAGIALTNLLAPDAPQYFFILSFSAQPTVAATAFNPAAAASAAGSGARFEANRPDPKKAAAASAGGPGATRVLARRSFRDTRGATPVELRQRLGIAWNNSPDYILVSKAVLKQPAVHPDRYDHCDALSPAACAALSLTAAERATVEGAFKRAEAEHAAWVKTAVRRIEPAGDILADYRIPANLELARHIEAEQKAVLCETLGRDRCELVGRWSNRWWFWHGALGEDNFRFTVRRHTDGRPQPLWYELVVPENAIRATQDGDLEPGAAFPDLLRSVFPGGWRELAQREGFALPQDFN